MEDDATVEPLARKLGERLQTFEVVRAECGAGLDLDADHPARPILKNDVDLAPGLRAEVE
jgi:hypothetical protein